MVCSFIWSQRSSASDASKRIDLTNVSSVASGREMVTRCCDGGVMCYQEQGDWKFLHFSASRLTHTVAFISVSDPV